MENRAALGGLRIVDFTWVLAGPYATRILADFGAEVIKVQSRATMEGEESNLEGYFTTWNRNKRGITLDLSRPPAMDIVRRLVRISDVVIENFSPRVMHNWGLDYDTLSEGTPGLIMVSMSAMGQTGPWRDRVAFGATIQASCGLTHLTTFPNHPPIGLSYSYADHVAGLMATLAILEALEYRANTGQGQYIDLSQMEATCALLGVPLLDYTVNQNIAAPVGNGPVYQAAAPHNVYRCRGDDRWCALCVFNEEEWKGLCRAMGNPAWARGQKFNSLPNRRENAKELDKRIEKWTKQHTAEEVMEKLQQAGVAAGVVQDAADLRRDPQLADRGFYAETEHPVLGKTTSDGSAIGLSQTPAQFDRASPLVGQDNDYVFRQLLGMSDEEIAWYEEIGVFR